MTLANSFIGSSLWDGQQHGLSGANQGEQTKAEKPHFSSNRLAFP